MEKNQSGKEGSGDGRGEGGVWLFYSRRKDTNWRQGPSLMLATTHLHIVLIEALNKWMCKLGVELNWSSSRVPASNSRP
jgi:hypothetical protein